MNFKKYLVSHKGNIRFYIVCVAVVFTTWFLLNYVFLSIFIPTGSMENTIMSNTWVVGSRLAYEEKPVSRGDIILLKCPDKKETDSKFVKRVIGLPNEKIEIVDGTVKINGKPLVEPYVKSLGKTNFGPLQIPDNEYFVLGDNRENSYDSKSWVTSPTVNKNKIYGKISYSLIPNVKNLEKEV